MKLVVGLGNPGKEYENTRHNVGFMAINNYLGNVTFKEKDNYLLYEIIKNQEKVLFLKPLTFMNDSGLAVKKVMDYYKINIQDIIVIYDDIDFEVGKFKVKLGGSSAGHNGIKSIIKELKSEEFKRIRIGISKPKGSVIDYVLGRFSSIDSKIINETLNMVNNIIDDYFILDFNKIMSKYNK